MYGWDHGSWMFGDGGGWMIFGWFWMALIGSLGWYPSCCCSLSSNICSAIGNPARVPREKRAGQRWIFWMKRMHAGN
ncbi:hypothetical protein TPL01_01880 [Sulfuriferula plumbiphila]|uniref:Uncharacterized protein n=1 Tax=Sulfuriferula plumbiphila TaxID=171865 RepID=A0A512L3J9_9PROT|nr:hypothetical protein SFPGR_01780 [Sulfuriferula plumbiphila]GEP29050.1 hypothetical protein TPL01_01880 [Sulfuriferula plumbiphila]